jgi:FkbM family methyltransferase
LNQRELTIALDKPFESFAQNFEDAVLWRVLNGIQAGCYVDVGAFDPVVDSISWAYYERGWRGVLVEPVPSRAVALRARRPGDVTIEAAAGAANTTATFFATESTGNSTLLQPVAERISAAGDSFNEITVRVAPLDDLLDEGGLTGSTIHFCTIDVEGTEAEALAGFDLRRWRPWILVVEATEPNRPRSTHEPWEGDVLDAGYHFCLFDGVNRFYVHADKASEFQSALSYPPCIFDGAFNRARARARETDQLERTASDALRRSAELEQHSIALAVHTNELRAELSAMRESWSWRSTRPIRVAGRLLARHRRGLPRREDSAVEATLAARSHDAREGSELQVSSVEVIDERSGVGDRGSWPTVSNGLVPIVGNDFIEGGRRTEGQIRTGTRTEPLVTYVTVVRNNATTLGRVIESVQEQTYTNVEHVVLDGASTDDTLEAIKSYANRIDYFASEPDRGVYDALNKAIPLARGDLVCVLNSDDWLEPDAAATAVSVLRGITSPAILATGALVRTPERPPPANVVFEWYPALVHPGCYFSCADVCHNGIYATRTAYEQSGPYDATYDIAGDFNWIMRCLEASVTFRYTDQITVNYVTGGISSDPAKHGRECIRTMRDHFPSLSSQEAGGLYHAFFFLPPDSSIPGRPSDSAQFIREFFIDHADDEGLLRAVGWALVHRHARYHDPGHLSEVDLAQLNGSATARALAEQLARLLLNNHPRLYRTVGRVYTAARRR